MLYSRKYGFLYVHIAKTGGTSMRSRLKRLLWKDSEYYPRFICHKLSGFFGHRLGSKIPRHAHIIAAKEMLPHGMFESLFKFAFVRNPWDLQVSSWYHLKRERPALVEGIKDFKDFIRYKLDPKRKYQYHLDTSIELQSDYLVDLNGTIVCNFIGRFEALQEDYKYICNKIGIKPLSLPNKRKAQGRGDYHEYYDNNTAELVYNYFKKDIEKFDYKF